LAAAAAATTLLNFFHPFDASATDRRGPGCSEQARRSIMISKAESDTDKPGTDEIRMRKRPSVW
jgi:hypothetical protein